MEFIWAVAESGYEVVDAVGVNAEGDPATQLAGRFISARDWGGPRYRKRYYDPFEPKYRTLPRLFAELWRAGEDRVVEFANHYGTLGDAQTCWIERSPGDGHYDRLAEPLTVWQHEVEAMACAIGLWDSRKSGDLVRIMNLVMGAVNHTPVRVQYTSPSVDFARRNPGFNADPVLALSQTQRLQFEKLGLRYTSPAIDAMTAAYERHNHPPHFDIAMGNLMRLVNHKLTPRVRPQLFWSPDGSGLEGHDSPVDLLGGMWQLLFDAVCTSAEHKRCAGCRQWYEVSLAASRSDRQYCSDACRMKVYRQRVKARKHPGDVAG